MDKKNKAEKGQQEGAEDKINKYKSGINTNKYNKAPSVKMPSMPNISMPKI